MTGNATFFARLSPWAARGVTVALVIGVLGCLYVSLSGHKIETLNEKAPPGKGDMIVAWEVVRRVSAGEDFYHAMTEENSRHGYPTTSVFNWRSPLPFVLIARFPRPELAKLLLASVSLATIIMAFTAWRRHASLFESLGAALLLSGALLHVAMEEQYVLPILWAESFIALSVCAYGLKLTSLGVICGIVAAINRDLALLYCALMFVWAITQRNPKEVGAWAVGLAGLGAYYFLHAVRVAEVAGTGRGTDFSQWLQFEGLAFVVSTAQVNAFLLELPQWVTAIFLPCSILGLVGWNDAWGRRVAFVTVGYLVTFFVAGKTVNQYWGLLIAPMLCFGARKVSNGIERPLEVPSGNCLILAA